MKDRHGWITGASERLGSAPRIMFLTGNKVWPEHGSWSQWRLTERLPGTRASTDHARRPTIRSNEPAPSFGRGNAFARYRHLVKKRRYRLLGRARRQEKMTTPPGSRSNSSAASQRSATGASRHARPRSARLSNISSLDGIGQPIPGKLLVASTRYAARRLTEDFVARTRADRALPRVPWSKQALPATGNRKRNQFSARRSMTTAATSGAVPRDDQGQSTPERWPGDPARGRRLDIPRRKLRQSPSMGISAATQQTRIGGETQTCSAPSTRPANRDGIQHDYPDATRPTVCSRPSTDGKKRRRKASRAPRRRWTDVGPKPSVPCLLD